MDTLQRHGRETRIYVYRAIGTGIIPEFGSDPSRIRIKHIKYNNPKKPICSIEVHRDSLSGNRCKDGYKAILFERFDHKGEPGWSKIVNTDYVVIVNEDKDIIVINTNDYKSAAKKFWLELEQYPKGYGQIKKPTKSLLVPISYFETINIYKNPLKPKKMKDPFKNVDFGPGGQTKLF